MMLFAFYSDYGLLTPYICAILTLSTAEAYSDLLAPGSSDGIRDGSYHFKKRFMALSRAGKQV